MKFSILPVEIIFEILSRLPVKLLLKLRCVSKSWFFLISSREFIKRHLSLSANKEDSYHALIIDIGLEQRIYKECPLKSLLCDSVGEALELDFPIGKSGRVWGSCNGLVYLVAYRQYSFIWNPTTRKHKTLPPFTTRLKEPFVDGFGYDKVYDDYKVVVVSYNDVIQESDDIEAKVYSLQLDSWYDVDYCSEEILFIKKEPDYCGEILCGRGVFVSGKLHWGTLISDNPTRDFFDINSRNIIAFDLANEKWEKVDKPIYGEGEMESFVWKLGRDLSVFCNLFHFGVDKITYLGIWVMKEYGVKKSWIKMFNIRHPPNSLEWYPNFFMSNKGEILSVFGATSMIYNSKEDSAVCSQITKCDYCPHVHFYIESLACPFSTEWTENTAMKESWKKLV